MNYGYKYIRNLFFFLICILLISFLTVYWAVVKMTVLTTEKYSNMYYSPDTSALSRFRIFSLSFIDCYINYYNFFIFNLDIEAWVHIQHQYSARKGKYINY